MKIIDNYRDLPIGMYLDICEIDRRTDIEELHKQVQILSLLTGETEEKIYNLPIEEYKELAHKSNYLCHPYEGEVKTANIYKVGEWVLSPVSDFRKITTAQYIDFQTFSKEGEKRIIEVLSTMLVPKGKKYNQDYDVLELQNDLRTHLSVVDALSLFAFFFRSVQSVNQGFVNLLQGGSNEDTGQGEEGADTEGDSENGGSFGERWGWISCVDAVSETCRCSWDDVWNMTAIEFLNILSYRRDKAEKDKEELEEWKRTH